MISHEAFVVREYTTGTGEEKKAWTKVGVLFPHKDNKGFNLQLDAVPVDGKLIIREYSPKESRDNIGGMPF